MNLLGLLTEIKVSAYLQVHGGLQTTSLKAQATIGNDS